MRVPLRNVEPLLMLAGAGWLAFGEVTPFNQLFTPMPPGWHYQVPGAIARHWQLVAWAMPFITAVCLLGNNYGELALSRYRRQPRSAVPQEPALTFALAREA